MQTMLFIWVGSIAFLLSVGATRPTLDDETRVLSGVASVALWGVWSLNATAVTKTTNAGVRVTHSYQSLSWIGIAIAGVMLLFVVDRVFQLVKDR